MKRAGNCFDVIKDDLVPIEAGANPPPLRDIVAIDGKTCGLYRVCGEYALLLDARRFTDEDRGQKGG